MKGQHRETQLHFHFAERLIRLLSDADFFLDLGLEHLDPSNRLLEPVAAPRSGAHVDYELQYLGLGHQHHHHYDFYD